MDLTIAEQGAYRLEVKVAFEQARDRAIAHKSSVFGTLVALLSRPKPEDIELQDLGMRYEPMWNAALRLHAIYDRHETYRIPFRLPTDVAWITVGTKDFPVEEGSEPGVSIPAIAHHVREVSKEVWLDAVTNEPIKTQAYAKADRVAIDLATFAPENAQVVVPLVRASTVIRDLLGDDIKPVEADVVHEQTANVERIDLYFKPLYAFRYEWAAKKKSAEISIDGVTGEIATARSPAAQMLTKLLDKDTLFDISVETAHTLVPFGGIPIRIVPALTRQQKP
jgi:hypothetical protein